MKYPYKYTIVGTLPQIEGTNRVVRYQIKTIKNKKEIIRIVGIGRLRTMYHDGQIEGHIDQYIKMKLGLERRKIRSDRKKPVPAPIVESKWNLKDFVVDRPKWSLPDEFKAIGQAYIFEKDGRWRVMTPDGTLDEDTYPDKEWAQSEADSLNGRNQ